MSRKTGNKSLQTPRLPECMVNDADMGKEDVGDEVEDDDED